MFIYCKKVDSELKQKINWTVYRKEICSFLWDSLQIMVGFYSIFLGFELNTYFIGLTHDQVEIAAYVAWNNIAGIVFTIGLGFGIISRRDVAHLLMHKAKENDEEVKDEEAKGDVKDDENIDALINKDLKEDFALKAALFKACNPVIDEFPNDARNLAWFNLFQTFCTGILICVIFNLTSYYLTLIYTQVPDVCLCLQKLIMIYAFCCIIEFSNGSLSCLMRLTNHVCMYSTLGFLYCVLVQGVLSYIFCFTLDLKATGL